jgi:hypothetical protein
LGLSELGRKNASDGYTAENIELVHAKCRQATAGGKRLCLSERVQVNTPNAVTEEFLRSFKKGDLVDVRTKHHWSGPHKLLVYKINHRQKMLSQRLIWESNSMERNLRGG